MSPALSRTDADDGGAADLGADYLRRLHQVTETLADATTPGEVAHAVVSAALPALCARIGRLFVFTRDGRALESAAALNLPEHLSLDDGSA